MATLVTHRRQGLGALLLAWARDRAVPQEKTVVRWDAWRTNEGLLRHYRSLGARHVRTEMEKAKTSGALFEMTAEKVPGLAVRTEEGSLEETAENV